MEPEENKRSTAYRALATRVQEILTGCSSRDLAVRVCERCAATDENKAYTAIIGLLQGVGCGKWGWLPDLENPIRYHPRDKRGNAPLHHRLYPLSVLLHVRGVDANNGLIGNLKAYYGNAFVYPPPGSSDAAIPELPQQPPTPAMKDGPLPLEARVSRLKGSDRTIVENMVDRLLRDYE